MLERDREIQDRDIRVETLYTCSAVEVPHMAEYLSDASRPGREVRLATHLPLRMLLFDDDLAVLPSTRGQPQGRHRLHGSELVRSLHSVYDHLWRSATPFRVGADHSSEGPVLGGYDRAIIKMLADGVRTRPSPEVWASRPGP
ncbi:hypothetical protein NKH77_48450 [Streptomyces sp. M19]